ncbi:unnamed protein product [Parnassius apollo]|uniref:(apollo) hypothetical protein n=1 Tax=Parnassius apollo TaxID=110799 RepID=A0A8S3Y348_PARAO|nr:unnamed protein product [Parnassius apollo]
MHSETILCTQVVQEIFGPAYTAQITINFIALMTIMMQMMASERTLINALGIVSTASAVLGTTGVLMCSAGDITIERPVVLKAYNIIELSYASFLSVSIPLY